MKLTVPQLLWYENTDLELTFPNTWNVEFRQMRGHDNPKLSSNEMRKAFSNPIGTAPIRDLARGKKEICIIFDDMTRPTRVSEIVPFLLDELRAAGITDRQIRFVAAIGTHGALTLADFRKKLGNAVLERFPVYNHNCFPESCQFIGTTPQGTPVAINKEVMTCDLKIAIGCIVPHVFTGFGGGSKIILPGVASIDTITANHKQATQEGKLLTIMGKYKNNPMLTDIEEATKLAGLDIKIDAIVNARGETTHLFVGDPIAEYYKGVAVAERVYATDPVKEADIVIANSYSKANEGSIAMRMGTKSLKEEGGDLVLISNAPEGQVVHYVYGIFGNEVGGRLWIPRTSNPPRVNNLIIFTQYPEKASWGWYAPPENIIWCKTWDDVLEKLKGQNMEPTVAVYPDLSIQYFPEELKE